MKPLIILGMLAMTLLPVAGAAETATPEVAAMRDLSAAQDRDAAAGPESLAVAGPGPHAAAGVSWEAQLYHSRPLVVFADSPENPDFIRQLQLLERDLPALEERRVVVVLDSDPAAQSDWRRRLRPNGFSLVLLDTDLRPVIRKPSPWDVREISRAIDKLPSRRQDLSEQYPAGR